MTTKSPLASLLMKKEGRVRTDIHCHHCSGLGQRDVFVAVINYSVNGNYKVECPRCGHHHYRVVVDGQVTEERYNSHYQTFEIPRRDIWFGENNDVVSSTASAFMRELWLRPKD